MTNCCTNARRHLIKDGDHKGEHDGTSAADGYLCRSCTRRLEQRIAELPWVYDWLTQNLESGRLGSERLTGSRDAPMPISVTVLALLGRGHDCDDGDGCHTSKCFGPAGCPGHHDPVGADNSLSIPGVLDGWIEVVLAEHPDRGLSGPEATITGCAAWLLARLDWIGKQDWVNELCREIDELVSRANAAVPWIAPPDRKDYRPTPCEKCDKRALVWRYPWFECDGSVGGCGNLMSLAEYKAWTKQWIARWDRNRRAEWAQDQEVAV